MFTNKIFSQYRLVRYSDPSLVTKVRAINPVDAVKIHNEFDLGPESSPFTAPSLPKSKATKTSDEESHYQLQNRGDGILKATDMAQHHLRLEAYKPYDLLKYESTPVRIVVLTENMNEKLVEWAATLAKLYQARIFFLHIYNENEDKDLIEKKWSKMVMDILEPSPDSVQYFDDKPEVLLVGSQHKFQAIQTYLNQSMANLLIIGHESNGLIGKLFNTDLSEQILLKMNLPMLIIPKNEKSVGIKNVLVLVDELPFSLDAIKQGIQFAIDLRASLYFFHVNAPEGETATSFESIKQSLNIPPHQGEDQWLIEEGDFFEMIDKVLREHQIDLVVFGTHMATNNSDSGKRTLAIINKIAIPCLILHPHVVL